MKAKLILLLLCSCLGANAQFMGKVYLDVDSNGKFTTPDKLIDGVRVSDGLNVVVTDREGHFNLPGYAKTRFISVSWPAGYRPYAKPYRPVSDTTKTYDFALVRDEKMAGKKIKILHISDTETDVYGNWIADIRNTLKGEQAAFTVHTGDICYEKGLQFHAAEVNESRLQRPIYYAMGNHDLVKGPYGEALFESLFGPPYYSFDAGPAHFIITPMASGDFKPDYTTDQLIAWLRNDLKNTDPKRPVFIFNHNLPFAKGSYVLKGQKDSIDLAKAGLKAWVYGHWHSNFVTKDQQNGIYTICTSALNKGGIDNAAGQYFSLEIGEKGIDKITSRYAYLKNHLVMAQPLTNQLNVPVDGKLVISVNAYDSAREIKNITVTAYNTGGEKMGMASLSHQFEWNWRGSLLLAAGYEDGKYQMLVTVSYRDGASSITRHNFELARTGTPSLKWSTNILGNIWKSSPVLAGDLLIVGRTDDQGGANAGVTALDRISGKKVWGFKTLNSVKNSLCTAKGMVLATDMEGIVYALELTTGKLLWKTELGMKTLPAYLGGAVLEDGIYYTGFGPYLSAIDVKTGKLIWKNTSWAGRMGSPAKMLLAKGKLFVGANWDALYAHDAKTGKLLWKRADDGIRFRSGAVSSDNGFLYVTALNSLLVLDMETGETLRKIDTPFDFKVMATPLLTDRLIILATAAHGLVAYDKATLKPVWQTPVGEALLYSAPYLSPDGLKPVQTVESAAIIQGQSLMFGASDGNVYSFDIKTGKARFKIPLGAPVYADLLISGAVFYAADFSGNVYCFDGRLLKDSL